METSILAIATAIIVATTSVTATASGVAIETASETIGSSSISIEYEEIEYKDAKYVWDYFQELDYNDYVCAGILGNMMVECGGHTLDLQSAIETEGYYGICQWSKKYYPDIVGGTLEEQCDFLSDNIEEIMDLFGGKDAFNDFLNIQDEKEAAIIFADNYERCASASYKARKKCASTAYEYFTSINKE